MICGSHGDTTPTPRSTSATQCVPRSHAIAGELESERRDQPRIKWGMPFFTIDDEMFCALGGHKSHVTLLLPGPPGTYADPDGRLGGEARTGRHLKVTSLAELPGPAVRGWLRTAAARARASK